MPLERAKCDDVVHGEEVGGVVELGDELQLAHDESAHLVGNAVGKAPVGALPGELLQMRLRGLAGRHRLVGIFVDELVEVERQAAAISSVRASASSWPRNRRAISAGL